ncbi:hypothetical protein ABFS82_11G016900 [Erythranthe guttata]|uniref:VQ domain-containing protein n=1 Tax=Erythranthe guttata TaxID=4155 RepID=A0A022PZA1_ERYGU|nr:PREDICTED: calmodulin-binding protein 25 [Erythranthe guttata]EYU20834.1 hypothetical protein MIMGU_mgv1a013460mg [Erythranthe guttata]|eukprot:XP_012857237.1 PREDICTED: calmodulin-binding protein 25 [Erythranthe guttata]
MAFNYDNLMMEQTWQFRPAFSDAWISDVFARENETLAKALQNSFAGVSSGHGDVCSTEMLQSLYVNSDATPLQTPTISGVSESDSPVPKNQRRGGFPASGRVAKRKPRPSKRAAATTFITADPANFRQMVQQVTGARFGGSTELLTAAPEALKPETRRSSAANYQAFGLPTLDTSAFFADGPALSPPSAVVADGGAAAAAAELYYDSVCSFPTLESWKAV